jgi:ApaG protein
MAEPIHELPGLSVTVDEVVHRDDLQAPPGQPHCFAYRISIHNDSDVTVTIKGRKWVVRDANGGVTALEGDGVVGKFPEIEPGGRFSYQSYHALETGSGHAEGSYLGITGDGRRVFTRIPRFEMRLPE